MKSIVLALVIANAAAAALITPITYLDYSSAKKDIIAGDLLTLRFMSLGKEYEKSFRTAFYDPTPESISEIKEGRMPNAARPDFGKTTSRIVEVGLYGDNPSAFSPEILQVMAADGDLTIRDMGAEIIMARKLYKQNDAKPYAAVMIKTTPGDLLSKVFLKNIIFYAILLVIVNGQAALVLAIGKSGKAIVYQKGYLKEHALGALKLHHKILGDIIADHEENSGDDDQVAKAKIVEFKPSDKTK